MGKATVYCEICGEVIPEDDFNKGRAVRFEEKDYCAKCKHEISHLLPPPEEDGALARKTSHIRTVNPTTPASGVRKSSGISKNPSGVRRSGVAPAVTATPSRGTPAPRGNGDHPSNLRMPAHAAPAPRSSDKTMYLIAGGAVLLIVLVIAIVTLNKGHEKEQEDQAAATKLRKAKEAYDLCAASAKTTEYDQILKNIAQAKADVLGTDYEMKLQHLQDETRKKKDERDAHNATLDHIQKLRLAIGTENKAHDILAELQKMQADAGEDAEIKERIASAIDEAKRQDFQNAYDDANKFFSVNNTEYDAALQKFQDLQDRLASLPKDYQDTMSTTICGRIQAVKDSRDDDARSQYGSVLASAEAHAARNEWAAAEQELEDFVTKDKYRMTKANGDARKKLDEMLAREKQARQKPPDNPPDTPPNGGGGGANPPGGAVSLFDGKTLPRGIVGPGTGGSSADWELRDGAIHVKHKVDATPNGQPTVTDAILWQDHTCQACQFEFKARIVRGGFGVFLSYRNEKPGEPGKAAVAANVTTPPVQANAWCTYHLEWDGKSAKCEWSINGVKQQALDIQQAGRGFPMLGVYPGCEAEFKDIYLTPK